MGEPRVYVKGLPVSLGPGLGHPIPHFDCDLSPAEQSPSFFQMNLGLACSLTFLHSYRPIYVPLPPIFTCQTYLVGSGQGSEFVLVSFCII